MTHLMHILCVAVTRGWSAENAFSVQRCRPTEAACKTAMYFHYSDFILYWYQAKLLGYFGGDRKGQRTSSKMLRSVKRDTVEAVWKQENRKAGNN